MRLARTKEWRESRGLTQRELATEASVGEVTVARIEGGASVTPPTARKIADALGISVADLMERPPVPLAEAPQETGPAAHKERWESALASVRERRLEIAARVGELVKAPIDAVDPYQVEWALKEAEACEYTLMLALPGSRQGSRLNEIIINPLVFAPEQWEEVRNASRFYASIVERLVEADLVVLKAREGQRAEPVPVGIGA